MAVTEEYFRDSEIQKIPAATNGVTSKAQEGNFTPLFRASDAGNWKGLDGQRRKSRKFRSRGQKSKRS